MLVVSFASEGAGNCVEVDGEPYMFARTALGSFVLPARCRHRGGPLHLGALEPSGSRLVCPWHERKTSVARHISHGLPAVRRGRRVTAVLPGTGEAQVRYRPIAESLCARVGARGPAGS